MEGSKDPKHVNEVIDGIADTLPIVSVTNVRSLGPKIQSVISEMIECSIDLLFVSKVWEKVHQPEMDSVLERIYEVEGES